MKKTVLILILVFVLCLFLISCTFSSTKEVNFVSPDNSYVAVITTYFTTADNSTTEEVYIYDPYSEEYSEVFYAYGCVCNIEWTDDNTLKIVVCKESVYQVQAKKEQWNDINIIYEEKVQDRLNQYEPTQSGAAA